MRERSYTKADQSQNGYQDEGVGEHNARIGCALGAEYHRYGDQAEAELARNDAEKNSTERRKL